MVLEPIGCIGLSCHTRKVAVFLLNNFIHVYSLKKKSLASTIAFINGGKISHSLVEPPKATNIYEQPLLSEDTVEAVSL